MNEFRRLHPTREGNRRWRFLTTTSGELPLYNAAAKHRPGLLVDRSGIIRASIEDCKLKWNPDYAWNGASPKRYVGWHPLGFWVGTPDSEETIIPTLGHDIFFQFASVLDVSFDEMNFHLYKWLKNNEYCASELWYEATQKFGQRFYDAADPNLKFIPL